MYAVVIKERIATPGYDRDDPNDWVEKLVFHEIASEQALINFIANNNTQASYYSKKDIVKILKYEELKAETSIKVVLG